MVIERECGCGCQDGGVLDGFWINVVVVRARRTGRRGEFLLQIAKAMVRSRYEKVEEPVQFG